MTTWETTPTAGPARVEWVGGKEMGVLFEHTGKVTEVDTFAQAVEKIEEGIKKQTKQ